MYTSKIERSLVTVPAGDGQDEFNNLASSVTVFAVVPVVMSELSSVTVRNRPSLESLFSDDLMTRKQQNYKPTETNRDWLSKSKGGNIH